MKQNPDKVRICEYIPDNIAQKINEIAGNSGGKPKVRHDNYLAIVGTIYFKCLSENNYAFIAYPIASNYWKKVVGDEYAEYVNNLLEAGIIKREKKKRRWRYSIEFNFMLQFHEVIRVDYRTKKIKSFHAIKGCSGYHIERIENRLGGRVLKHLKKINVDYEAFKLALRGGLLSVDPDHFKLDISEFPMDMDFDAEVHYNNSIYHHSYSVKTLLEKARELQHSIFHDKDRIRVMSEDNFRNVKTRNFINHSKLNLLKTIDGNYELSRDEEKTRRIFHTGVFLPSKALAFLQIDQQPIVGIDAKTSQFLLLANLFHAFVNDVDSIGSKFSGRRKTFIYDLYSVFKQQETNPDDIHQFYNDVVTQDFYEVVRDYLGLSQRSQAKIFCFTIIFSRPDNSNPFKEKLRERYPSIINTLDEYKHKQITRMKKEKGKANVEEGDGFQRLPINLQAMESEIFIEHLFQRLHKENIWCFTRHDSVVVSKQHQDKTLAIAKNVYKELGLTPKFEVEKYELPKSSEINSLPNDWSFLYDIDQPDDIKQLSVHELQMLLQELPNQSSSTEYNHIESRVIELDKHNLPLDDTSLLSLYNISIQLLSKFSTVS